MNFWNAIWPLEVIETSGILFPVLLKYLHVIGKVIVKIIIEKDGSVNSVSFLKGIGFGCDEEVERIVKLMPKWKAGIKDGKNVRTFFILPVMFALENTKKSK